MYIPTEDDRHIFLYAKNWYKRTDLIEDLKIILANRAGIKPKWVSIDDIIMVLGNVVEPFTTFQKFLYHFREKMRYNDWWYDFKTEELLIFTLLSELSFISVKDIPFELGEPDTNILPLREKG